MGLGIRFLLSHPGRPAGMSEVKCFDFRGLYSRCECVSSGLQPKGSFYKVEESQWHRVAFTKRILGLGKGPESKIFWALHAVGLCSHPSLCYCANTATDDADMNGHGLVPTNPITKIGGWLAWAHGHSVRIPALGAMGTSRRSHSFPCAVCCYNNLRGHFKCTKCKVS